MLISVFSVMQKCQNLTQMLILYHARHGGLGIPQNVFTACNKCHNEQDNGKNTKEYDKLAENYLKKCYGDNWDKSKLIYKKY